MTEKVKKIIEILELEPLTIEGGFYKETYRSEEKIPVEGLPPRYKSARTFSTLIYYLLTPETFSILHKLPSDEFFHFYMGDPVEMLHLYADGTGKIITIGNDIENGLFPQVVVPKNTWQGARLAKGGEYALFGVNVAPGFDYEDFIPPDREALIKGWPAFEEQIRALT